MTPFMQSEMVNLLRRCVSLVVLIEVSRTFFMAIARRLANRLFREKLRHYPAAIKESVFQLPMSPPFLKIVHVGTACPSGPRRLRLAVGFLEFKIWPDWETSFVDHEVFVSLHRWNWLLRALTDEEKGASYEWGIHLMRSWLLAKTPLPAGDASESYTVGERISNACLFSRIHAGNWHAFPSDISEALLCKANYLARHIEYHAGELSGNHVINNARALRMAGHCCDAEEYIDLGRELLKERLPNLLVDGFLREGSSHYQFLFARWLLELRLLCIESSDNSTLTVLEPYIDLVVSACQFFLVKGHDGHNRLPTFGDVSPDCEPDWLIDLPYSSLVQSSNQVNIPLQGWAQLFADEYTLKLTSEIQLNVERQGWQAYSNAGWYRLDKHGWTALWHVEDATGEAIASHAHHDLGSVVLFHEGREIWIDPGRHNYTSSNEMGEYGIWGASHSSLRIGDMDSMLSKGDRFFPATYRKSHVNVTGEDYGDEGFTIVIIHDGFTRCVGGVGIHRRIFNFKPERLEIVDEIDGMGSQILEARFQWPAGQSWNQEGINRFRMISEGNDYLLECVSERMESFDMKTISASDDPLAGWRFPAYGVREPSVSQMFSGEMYLPAKCRYVLTCGVV